MYEEHAYQGNEIDYSNDNDDETVATDTTTTESEEEKVVAVPTNSGHTPAYTNRNQAWQHILQANNISHPNANKMLNTTSIRRAI